LETHSTSPLQPVSVAFCNDTFESCCVNIQLVSLLGTYVKAAALQV
jgi:hypothetical protein